MLPSPIPDDPKKWEGWRAYDSPNFYHRLCLRFEDDPPADQIEDHCRQLLVWWQKKLPLKSQPSNPLAQLLRAGLDEAPRYLTEARVALLNPDARARIDAAILEEKRQEVFTELGKFLSFSLTGGVLTLESAEQLHRLGAERGLSDEEIDSLIDGELAAVGARRETAEERKPPPAPEVPAAKVEGRDPKTEFKRLLGLSGLDEGDITDDQRDALVNMGENLGLTGGEAEDMIDDWLEAQAEQLLAAQRPKPRTIPAASTTQRMEGRSHKHVTGALFVPPKPDMSVAEEREKFPPFRSLTGATMLLVPAGNFMMGAAAGPEAQPNEQPPHRVYLSRFFMAEVPVTNAAYEMFDAGHASRRAPGAGPDHPVVYVTSHEAMRFCEWLSAREGRRYRLPTEAEWEFAARGPESRLHPWGTHGNLGRLANFADKNTSFPWSDPAIDDGHAGSSPVGAYRFGAGPFGHLDLAGNVWEWCSDFYDRYKPGPQMNPRGPSAGGQRVMRGGSWRTRAGNLRGAARGFNVPSYSRDDVGFRVVCECR